MTAQTQTAHIVALYFDLVPEKYRAQTAERLVELLEEQQGHLVTGFVGTPYFCHALSENGYVEEAYRLLLKEDFLLALSGEKGSYHGLGALGRPEAGRDHVESGHEFL